MTAALTPEIECEWCGAQQPSTHPRDSGEWLPEETTGEVFCCYDHRLKRRRAIKRARQRGLLREEG